VDAIVVARWEGENATVIVYDEISRDRIAEILEEDSGSGCDALRFEGPPQYLDCARSAQSWLYDAYNYGQCDIHDYMYPDGCSNDPAVCVVDEVPR
jgi:hypothetical protein